MSTSKTIEFESIGQVILRKYKKSKYLRISVKVDGTVLLSMPWRCPWSQGITFLKEKAQWIIHQQSRMEVKRQQQPQLPQPTAQEIKSAKSMLNSRLQTLAQQFGYKYNRVSFRRQKTVWGSCSAANNISLNINLMYLPQDLLDYVLIHELAHTKVKNHSDKFWREMDYNLGKPGMAKILQKKLRKFSLTA